MYIRTKSRTSKNGKIYSYAYLVKSKYRKKYPIQKVKKYLGPIIHLQKEKELTLKDLYPNLEETLKKLGFKDLLLSLLVLELKKHSFTETSPKIFQKENIQINLNTLEIKKKPENTNLCLKLNEGYLCKETLTFLFSTDKTQFSDTKKLAKHLAKNLINAGISPEKDIFIILVQKLLNQQ